MQGNRQCIESHLGHIEARCKQRIASQVEYIGARSQAFQRISSRDCRTSSLSQLSHFNCVASHHILSHRLSWRCASHQRILSRCSKYVGRRSKGCITSQKIECMTSTVWHELSTEDHTQAQEQVAHFISSCSHRSGDHIAETKSRQRISSHLADIGVR